MKIYIKPAVPGSIVRYPDRMGKTLPDEGDRVEKTPFWVRRLRDGSVIEAKPPKGGKE